MPKLSKESLFDKQLSLISPHPIVFQQDAPATESPQSLSFRRPQHDAHEAPLEAMRAPTSIPHPRNETPQSGELGKKRFENLYTSSPLPVITHNFHNVSKHAPLGRSNGVAMETNGSSFQKPQGHIEPFYASSKKPKGTTAPEPYPKESRAVSRPEKISASPTKERKSLKRKIPSPQKESDSGKKHIMVHDDKSCTPKHGGQKNLPRRDSGYAVFSHDMEDITRREKLSATHGANWIRPATVKSGPRAAHSDGPISGISGAPNRFPKADLDFDASRIAKPWSHIEPVRHETRVDTSGENSGFVRRDRQPSRELAHMTLPEGYPAKAKKRRGRPPKIRAPTVDTHGEHQDVIRDRYTGIRSNTPGRTKKITNQAEGAAQYSHNQDKLIRDTLPSFTDQEHDHTKAAPSAQSLVRSLPVTKTPAKSRKPARRSSDYLKNLTVFGLSPLQMNVSPKRQRKPPSDWWKATSDNLLQRPPRRRLKLQDDRDSDSSEIEANHRTDGDSPFDRSKKHVNIQEHPLSAERERIDIPDDDPETFDFSD